MATRKKELKPVVEAICEMPWSHILKKLFCWYRKGEPMYDFYARTGLKKNSISRKMQIQGPGRYKYAKTYDFVMTTVDLKEFIERVGEEDPRIHSWMILGDGPPPFIPVSLYKDHTEGFVHPVLGWELLEEEP